MDQEYTLYTYEACYKFPQGVESDALTEIFQQLTAMEKGWA